MRRAAQPTPRVRSRSALIPRRQRLHRRADAALGGRRRGRPCPHRRGLDAAGGALSVGIGCSIPVRHGPTLERVRMRSASPRLPPVLTSAAVRGAGRGRPVAVRASYCPKDWPSRSPSDSLRDVLVHECAHVVRLDAWVGLLQRLAGAIFWPHPLVHYASGQLTRAREEVCDNHVLRCGDPRGYARTLLALTEQCRPLGAVRPGLGLLGARWTLADRVAGLLDTRRIPMTRTTFRMKIAVAIALAVTALAAWGIRLDRPARAGESQR